ncbi:MAG: glycosyltransferase family 4 protein [Ignavibacteria bacterium]|nr:glycosyltransferase family 4 protein [Ignavibacteria bacterium]
MKIAVYSGNIPSTTFIENLIEGLCNSGFEILLFGKQTQNVSYSGNVKAYPTPVNNLKLVFFVIKESVKLFFKDSKLFFKFHKTVREKNKSLKSFFKNAGVLLPVLNNKPDIFHIQWAKTVEMYPELFELFDCKVALSLRGAHINYSPLLDKNLAEAYRKNFPSIDGFHAVSNAIAAEAMKYGADEKKIKVIHSSVKDELFEKYAELFRGDTKLEIISVGRFHWKKGYHYALDAMKILADKGISFNYTIVAQGVIPEEILFLLDEYRLGEKVRIIQGLKHEELIMKLQSSHLLLLPSVEEGIANVVLEAMAVGVPVITTDCGGMSEVVEDNNNGYTVSVRDPETIAAKVIQFIGTEFNAKKDLALKGKQTIEKEFTREKQIREFTDFYESILKNN